MGLVYTTVGSLKDAKRLAKSLLDAKLAGCVVWLPAGSSYVWKGKRKVAHEYVVLCKTTTRKLAALKKRVARIHPYDVPCILSTTADANSPYAAWLALT